MLDAGERCYIPDYGAPSSYRSLSLVLHLQPLAMRTEQVVRSGSSESSQGSWSILLFP